MSKHDQRRATGSCSRTNPVIDQPEVKNKERAVPPRLGIARAYPATETGVEKPKRASKGSFIDRAADRKKKMEGFQEADTLRALPEMAKAEHHSDAEQESEDCASEDHSAEPTQEDEFGYCGDFDFANADLNPTEDRSVLAENAKSKARSQRFLAKFYAQQDAEHAKEDLQFKRWERRSAKRVEKHAKAVEKAEQSFEELDTWLTYEEIDFWAQCAKYEIHSNDGRNFLNFIAPNPKP